jgi:hypothetical protein
VPWILAAKAIAVIAVSRQTRLAGIGVFVDPNIASARVMPSEGLEQRLQFRR